MTLSTLPFLYRNETHVPILLATPPRRGAVAAHLSNKACAALLISVIVTCATVAGAMRKTLKLQRASSVESRISVWI